MITQMNLVFHQFQADYLPALTELWNAAAGDCYGFHPLTADILRRHVLEFSAFSPEKLLVASSQGTIVGMVHYDVVNMVPYYPRAGVIAALLVRPDWRGRGCGQALLREALARLSAGGETLVDALGAWPYSSYYVGLIDGSERAGIDCADAAALRIFSKAGFLRGRRALHHVVVRQVDSPPGRVVKIPPGGAPARSGPRGHVEDVVPVVFLVFDLPLVKAPSAVHGKSLSMHLLRSSPLRFCMQAKI